MITVNPAGDHWTFTAPSGSVWSGGADDGKLYAVTLSDIPDNPSLPGLSDIPLIVADIIASVDGAAQAGPPPPGGASDPLSDQAPGSSGAAEEITAPKGARTLNQTVEGVHKGTYSQLVLGKGFVGGVRDIATDAGVTDTLKGTPSDGALTFGGERNRALNVNLGIDHGEVHRQATVATQASKGGADTVALGNGSALVYTHRGATTRASFTLTNVSRNGGPATFTSGPVTVRRGERVRLVPTSWRSLDRVKASFSKGGSKTLHNRASFPGRFSLGTPKLSHGRAVVATSIRRLPADTATGGVVLRLLRGHHTVARKAVALTAPQRGHHSYSLRIPSGVKRGTYRLVANMALAGGARQPGRRTATKAARVRLG